MSNNLNDILSGGNEDIDNQKLINYLKDQLSAEDNHEIEKNMADDEFMNDAVEGLQNIENKKNMQDYVDQLNKDLHKKLNKNKTRKEKRKFKEQPYTMLTIIIVLVLAVLSFIVLKKYLETRAQNKPVTVTSSTSNKPAF